MGPGWWIGEGELMGLREPSKAPWPGGRRRGRMGGVLHRGGGGDGELVKWGTTEVCQIMPRETFLKVCSHFSACGC